MNVNLSKQALLWLKEEYTHLTPEDLEQVNLALNTIKLEETLEANRIKTFVFRGGDGQLKQK